MKILYIITKSGSGGAQTHITQLAQYMCEQGHVVAVMAHPDGTLKTRVETVGAQFYPNPSFSNNYDPFAGIAIMRTIREAVADFKPDVVSLHSSSAGFWGRLAIRNTVPTVFTAHGWGFTDGVPFLRKIIAMVAEKYTARFARKIICVSEKDRMLAVTYHIAAPSNITTIHNGVEDLSLLFKKHVTTTSSGKIRIVFVGRLDPQKDPESLIRAYASLPQALRMTAELYIVGDGPKRKMLNELVSHYGVVGDVHFAGDVPRQKVFDILSDGFSDACNTNTIFALISHYEGFPRSILEAMSLGLAIIASDVGGVSEAIDETTGIIVPLGDGGAITAALTKLLSDPSRIPLMGATARQKMLEEFTLEQMLQNTEKIYTEILASQK